MVKVLHFSVGEHARRAHAGGVGKGAKESAATVGVETVCCLAPQRAEEGYKNMILFLAKAGD